MFSNSKYIHCYNNIGEGREKKGRDILGREKEREEIKNEEKKAEKRQRTEKERERDK